MEALLAAGRGRGGVEPGGEGPARPLWHRKCDRSDAYVLADCSGSSRDPQRDAQVPCQLLHATSTTRSRCGLRRSPAPGRRNASAAETATAAAEHPSISTGACIRRRRPQQRHTGPRRGPQDPPGPDRLLLDAHPDGPIFRSLPRAGTIRAAALLAEIGDCRGRFPDPELAAAAGVAPSTRSSGRHRPPSDGPATRNARALASPATADTKLGPTPLPDTHPRPTGPTSSRCCDPTRHRARQLIGLLTGRSGHGLAQRLAKSSSDAACPLGLKFVASCPLAAGAAARPAPQADRLGECESFYW